MLPFRLALVSPARRGIGGPNATEFYHGSHPDLAVGYPGTNSNDKGTVSVLLGNGDGTFQAAHNYAAGITPTSVAVGDFNGDGHLDLAVGNGGNYSDFKATSTPRIFFTARHAQDAVFERWGDGLLDALA